MLHHHADFVSATVHDRVRTAQREARASAVVAGTSVSTRGEQPVVAPARPRSLLAALLRRPRPT